MFKGGRQPVSFFVIDGFVFSRRQHFMVIWLVWVEAKWVYCTYVLGQWTWHLPLDRLLSCDVRSPPLRNTETWTKNVRHFADDIIWFSWKRMFIFYSNFTEVWSISNFFALDQVMTWRLNAKTLPAAMLAQMSDAIWGHSGLVYCESGVAFYSWGRKFVHGVPIATNVQWTNFVLEINSLRPSNVVT